MRSSFLTGLFAEGLITKELTGIRYLFGTLTLNSNGERAPETVTRAVVLPGAALAGCVAVLGRAAGSEKIAILAPLPDNRSLARE
jgi:hypothetical protein